MKKGKKSDRSKLKIFLIIIVIVALALGSAIFVKYAVSGLLLSSTTYAVSTELEKNIVTGCEKKLSELSCSRWTTCEDSKRTRTCKDGSGCLPYTGHFVQTQTCSVDIKTGSISTGPAIAEFCNSNSQCEEKENYFMCPNDCKPNAEDNVCNDKTDGLCDPDCGTNDLDCVQRPIASKFSPELSTNLSSFDSFTLKNLELGIKDRGSILFKEAVDISGADLDRHVNIGYNLISVNLEKLPALNVSARITLYNLVFNETAILFDGQLCRDCKIKSYKNGTLVFDVKQIGTFRAEEKQLAMQQFGKIDQAMKSATKWSVLYTVLIIIVAALILIGALYAYYSNFYKKLIPKLEKRTKQKTKQEKEPEDFKLRPTKDLMDIKPFPKIKEQKKKELAIPIVVVKKKTQKVQTIKPKTIVVQRVSMPKHKSKVLYPVSRLPKFKVPKDPYKEERLMRERAAKKRLETMRKKEKAEAKKSKKQIKKSKKKAMAPKTKKPLKQKKKIKKVIKKQAKKKAKRKVVKKTAKKAKKAKKKIGKKGSIDNKKFKSILKEAKQLLKN
ncbi:hypothetical protein KY340_02455 [Candidatus Woesearchaeota archaeon]|nr:hypothetical protein [Candidatus Woesearchaeota archaeon]